MRRLPETMHPTCVYTSSGRGPSSSWKNTPQKRCMFIDIRATAPDCGQSADKTVVSTLEGEVWNTSGQHAHWQVSFMLPGSLSTDGDAWRCSRWYVHDGDGRLLMVLTCGC